MPARGTTSSTLATRAADYVICGIGRDIVIVDPSDFVAPDCEEVTVLKAI